MTIHLEVCRSITTSSSTNLGCAYFFSSSDGILNIELSCNNWPMLTFGRRGSCSLHITYCCNRSCGILLHAVEGETITQLLFFTNAIMYEPEYDVRCNNV